MFPLYRGATSVTDEDQRKFTSVLVQVMFPLYRGATSVTDENQRKFTSVLVQVMFPLYRGATSVTDENQRTFTSVLVLVGINNTIETVRKLYAFKGKQILRQKHRIMWKIGVMRLVETLLYKPGGRSFHSRWGYCNFLLA